ncbi:MAG: hypothetical protein U0905_04795 [Pirellulales bacterium]
MGSDSAAASKDDAKQAEVENFADAQDKPKASTDIAVQTAANKPAPEKAAASTIKQTPKRKQIATPTPEQIAEWKVAPTNPWQLLACVDGIGDSLVQAVDVAPDFTVAIAGTRLHLWRPGQATPSSEWLDGLKDQVERPLRCVAFSPDGKLLAAGDQKGQLLVWKVADGSLAWKEKAHSGRLVKLAFAPSGKQLATTSYDGVVFLWDLEAKEKSQTIQVAKREIVSMDYVQENQMVIAVDQIQIWDLAKGESVKTLSQGRLVDAGLAVSPDGKTIYAEEQQGIGGIFASDNWTKKSNAPIVGNAAALNSNGKWLATQTNDSSIRIWNCEQSTLHQLIDTTGNRANSLAWLPGTDALLIATEQGRLRIWGTDDARKTLGIPDDSIPVFKVPKPSDSKPAPALFLSHLIDLRSLPLPPKSEYSMSTPTMASIKVGMKMDVAEQYYGALLSSRGWNEVIDRDTEQPGRIFEKEGCRIAWTLSPSFAPNPSGQASPNADSCDVQMYLVGNVDARTLPKPLEDASKLSYAFFNTVGYRSKASIPELEVNILKTLSSLGWVPYSRLNAGMAEQPDMRLFSLLQHGMELSVMISIPADDASARAVQMNLQVHRNAIPVPPKSSWIEWDGSQDMLMVAYSPLPLQEVMAYYETALPEQGWQARKAGRVERSEEKIAVLPFIHEQRDLQLILQGTEKGTWVHTGNKKANSWQLVEKTETPSTPETAVIEAAEFPLATASKIKFDVDGKQIECVFPDLPPANAERLAKLLEPKKWIREKSGVVSDEYTLAIFKNGKKEIEYRGRKNTEGQTEVIFSGDGLSWKAPLPSAPTPVSYETWLRRKGGPASLDSLDSFLAEMNQLIPKP